ncbi:MAG TPA: F0F1 ATP synthase subunit alpha [Polyangiaceae bacterium]
MTDLRIEQLAGAVGRSLIEAARQPLPEVWVRDEGRITEVRDGVVRVAGLPSAAADELLELESGELALGLSLEPGSLKAVALGDTSGVSVGSRVRATGKVATLPVGEALLGRVIDPLGRPLDGRPLYGTLVPQKLERRAPQLYQRASVHQPLYTGSLAVDALCPIGRGQRELIIGEEGTGKTSLAVDAILRQKNTGVIGVYVAIARRRVDTWQVVETLRRHAERWVVIAVSQDASPGLRYLAPYAGASVAEHFAERGEHTLIVYDDLTAHAIAWRELSLLLNRPPGREAYPGDIFYLHARLLERAAQLSTEHGGGSVTALPISLLEGGRLTAYIPTNLISITDGQIVLSRSLFASGQKPALDAGLSVSRVGGKAQPQAVRALSARLRLDYAAFLELEAFSRIGTRLEERTERKLQIGRRIRRLLRAQRLAPLGLFQEVVRLMLASEPALLLRIPEAAVEAASAELSALAESRLVSVAGRVERDALLADADRRALLDLCQHFVRERFRRGSHASAATPADLGDPGIP